MGVNLGTTNLLLGIMAAVSVLEALLIVGVGIAAFAIYRRVMDLVTGLEARHLAPAMSRVNAILDDAKHASEQVRRVSEQVREETERVDHAIRSTMDRVDHTAERVRSNFRAKTSWVVGAIRGMRVAIDGMLHSDSRQQPPAGAADRVM
jgi:hypothetical protein